MQITSAQNPLVRKIRKAAHSGRAMGDGCLVLEGPNLLGEALRSPWTVVEVLATPKARLRWPDLFDGGTPVTEISEHVVDSISGTEASQGIVSLAVPARWSFEHMLGDRALILVLDGIQDPGNAGTLVRSAEAFGATGVIFCGGSVRISNGKFLRAAAGSIFRIPYVDSVDYQQAASLGVHLFTLDARAGRSIYEVDLVQPCALAIGNEGNGVSTFLRENTTAISIPAAKVESLNAAVAGSIALFEAAHQRAPR